ncbi:non-ribosomal peptide synthetase [Streptomyces pinistramenti]|uniref:non-ribosomal peptide synthetase n=1 Tax=Streptomyces pinistramenti TaxID=2884812 RepID=UPI001D084FB2|nr:non-ribosomal peptide synthetase [Streptomyces pinistramenti]MCB5906942.1 amino acid adenylation domain-containing protein [Streptomyces pinistramenti]
MNDPTDPVLAALVARGGDLRADDGRLRLRGPDGILTPQLREDVAAHRDALLARLRDRRVLPLSGIQRRLWFLQELDASGTGYTFSYAHRLRGPLDPAALDAALNAVLAAHPGLRAGFDELAGHPVQFLADAASVTTTVFDPGPGQEGEKLLREELVRPFDLARPPLIRSALVRLGDDDWLWGLTVHHLIADGWTYGLLLDGISDAYAGRVSQPAAEYAEFVAHERAVEDTPGRTAALDHWAKTLADATADGTAELPADRPRPRQRGYRGATVGLTLPAATTRKLRALAEAEGTTLFAALLAVHGVLLGRHTGSDLTVVGTPYANRPDTRFHGTAGCFVSTLVLPVDLTGRPTFRQLVAGTGRTCATAWDHCDYAYERLVERLAPQRDPSRNALFQTFLALQDLPGRLTLPQVTAAPVPFDAGTTQFDLEVYLTPAPDGALELELRYNTDLFDPATATAFAHRWQQLAQRLADTPDHETPRVPVLSDADLRALAAANDTARPSPQDATADDLFAAQAARTPDRTALRCGDQEWSYRRLDARVDALAGLLRDGDGAGGRVGIVMHRSADMVAAVLASLRAGAAFVPLAPDLPTERMAQMSADCALTAAWTDPDTAGLLPPGIRPLDATADVPPPGPAPAREHGDLRTTAAYVLYTSGSTGVPKGVEVPHSALVNLLAGMGEHPGIGADDVLVAVTALFFDISLLELLLPLLTGATLVVATDAETRDPDRLAALLERHDATVVQATPSTWRMLLDSGWPGRPRLRAWSGGEALSRDLADRLLGGCAEAWNLYGPTETTIWSTCWQVRPGDGPVLMGQPVANTTLHVLDRNLMPVPPGVPGELYIGGDGLALGYLHRPELTAERFVTLDTGDGPAERAYRTGDVVRWPAGGDPVFLGRADDQLKVRGHRIEPEEIEHALRRHPAVRDAVVVPAGDEVLVAHLLPADPTAPPAAEELTAHLGGLLRPALIPQRFVPHTELPRTANGKTDRGALRRMALPVACSSGASQPPEGAEELAVAAVYEEVLGITGAGRLDDFFRLGGHSLTATTVLYRLRQSTGTRVPLHVFMQDASVAAVARHLRPADDLETALALLDSLSDEEAAALLADTP